MKKLILILTLLLAGCAVLKARPEPSSAVVPPATSTMSVSEPHQSEEITIGAVGDIMLGGRAEPFLHEFGPDYPFRKVAPVLRRADIIAGNLESSISEQGAPFVDKKFLLRVSPIAAEALKSAGIRVVSLANNHSMDFGPLALEDTLNTLTDNNILFTGAGMNLDDARTPALVRVKGKTLAFLSYSLTFPLEFFASANQPGTAPGYDDFVKADIEKVRPLADLVIVSFHWGAELMTAAKDYQIALGRHAIDWGADLVLGHHPHVLQDIELYRGRLIVYSLGNFVFGSESDRTNWSMILLLTFRGNSLVKAEAVPIDVNNYRVKYQPTILRGEKAREVLDTINSVSARWQTGLRITDDRGMLAMPTLEATAPAANLATRASLTVPSQPAPGN